MSDKSLGSFSVLVSAAINFLRDQAKVISYEAVSIKLCDFAMAKAAFNKKKNLFTSKLDLNLRKKLLKCYVWSMALCGAET